MPKCTAEIPSPIHDTEVKEIFETDSQWDVHSMEK